MKEVTSLTLAELRELADQNGKDYVKAVVDVKRGTMVVGMRFHDEAVPLLEEGGSLKDNLWGIRLRPDSYGSPTFVEYNSMLNIKPEQDNTSTSVDDEGLRGAIVAVVDQVVES